MPVSGAVWLLLLGLISLLGSARKELAVSVTLGQGPGSRTVRMVFGAPVPPHIPDQSALDIANMSLSPWTYRWSHVPSRVPSRISQARCLTSGCVSQHGEDAALEAQPIYYQVLVLHRVPSQRQQTSAGKKKKKRRRRSRYTYSLGVEVVSAGCTCVRPSFAPPQ